MGTFAVFSLLALQVNPPVPAPFTDTKTAAAAVEAQSRSKPELAAEMRGDIAMARKEYRQAIDLYTQFGAEAPYWLGALILLLGVGAALLAAPAVHAVQPEPEAAQA